MPGQPPHPARRLKRPVGRVPKRPAEELLEPRCEVVVPVNGEPVLAQSRVFARQLGALGVIGCDAEAADAAEGVARELLEPIECPLAQSPESVCGVSSEAPSRLVIRTGPAAQGEAPIAAARAARDHSGFMDSHPHSTGCERERT
jgi:hypothetical protein